MYQNEDALLDKVNAHKKDPYLRAEVSAAVEEILAVRRGTVLDFVTNPMQKQAVVQRGASQLKKRFEVLGIDPELQGDDGTSVAEALSAETASVVFSAIMAHLMSLMNTES